MVSKRRLLIRSFCAIAILILLSSCGLRFSGGPQDNPFPPDLKTVFLQSASNNTTVTGIETEMTNDFRDEFALGTRLRPVRTGGDTILKTTISSYEDTPSTYRADNKELIRIGALVVNCKLENARNKKVLWQKDFSASSSYTVTDTISVTLTNRRQAISRMIKDLIPRIHRSMYDDF